MFDSANLFLALGAGLLPAVFWLWFWLKEDRHPEPKWLIALTFIAGMIATIAVIPVEKILLTILGQGLVLIFLWALVEEVFKFWVADFVALRRKEDDEPIDPIIYMITAALGFAALENTLFVINPLLNEGFVGALLTTNMRFIGATLLHTISSGIIGVFMGFSFYKNKELKHSYFYTGLTLAVVLHTLFNFFIIKGKGENIIAVFASVWILIILLLVLFEIIKRIKKPKF